MNNMKNYRILNVMSLALLLLVGCNQQPNSDSVGTHPHSDKLVESSAKSTSNTYATQVFWGDTHLHTADSVDAFGFGNRLDSEAALRFARGEQVTSTRGVPAKLSRPLDFLVIADHSDALGATRELYETPRLSVHNEFLRRWWDMMHESEQGSLRVTAELIDGAATGTLPASITTQLSQGGRIAKLWQAHNKVVDDYNEPGKFSAFVGFEFTPMPNGNNLHRVVMFRDGADKADTVIPISSSANPDPEQLWAWMSQYEADTGGQLLAMPHNSNLSNGLMFAMTRLDGSPIDQAYAETRARYEPVVEITQIKGDSESHPFLSPNDEFAGYGVVGWDKCNLSCSAYTEAEDYAGSYIREALKTGLKIERDTKVNPYAFGVIGSTDSHTSLATADENNFFGKHTANELNVAERAREPQNLGTREGRFGWHYLASGYAAAWATENSREAIFDAFKRREVYATTGPRIAVRFFAGFELRAADANGDFVAHGYQKGVPMGGELELPTETPSSAQAPTFIVQALMDPEGAYLDRVQIVKGWIDEAGDTHEQIINVAWSDPDNRNLAADGSIPTVGNTVDTASATWENSIGAPELLASWQDPEFSPSQNAFYYARVLEIPTPTWPLYDAVKNDIELLPDTITVQQERAYTSPIWYRQSK